MIQYSVLVKNLKYDGYQSGIVLMVYKFFDETVSSGNIKNQNTSNKELAVHKPIIRKFKKRKVNLSFINNIWRASLADMQLIIKPRKRFRFLLLIFIVYTHGLFL